MWRGILGLIGIALVPFIVWAIVKAVREPKRAGWWLGAAVVSILVEFVLLGSWVHP